MALGVHELEGRTFLQHVEAAIAGDSLGPDPVFVPTGGHRAVHQRLSVDGEYRSALVGREVITQGCAVLAVVGLVDQVRCRVQQQGVELRLAVRGLHHLVRSDQGRRGEAGDVEGFDTHLPAGG
ncbi:hypothetical protein D3C71_1578170 [compost metagenome]